MKRWNRYDYAVHAMLVLPSLGVAVIVWSNLEAGTQRLLIGAVYLFCFFAAMTVALIAWVWCILWFYRRAEAIRKGGTR